ncbi:MAG: AcvB/VirJ family lysyl-phosphatidylglycerol hydrolase [Gammaproteobacteria bacterium]
MTNTRPGWVIGLLSLALTTLPVQADETLSHGRFETLTLYRPAGPVKSVVLFLSGDGGWSLGVVDMAQALAKDGALVVGVDVPKLLANLEKDGESCVSPDGDLENLSHFVQSYAALPTYREPVLVGYSSGATLAYVVLAQAPINTFAGALSIGFCPDLLLHKPLCGGENLRFTRRKNDGGIDVQPSTTIGNPWIAVNGALDQVCDLAGTRDFVSRSHNASLVELPNVGHGYSVPKNWLPQFLAAFRKLAQDPHAELPPPPTALADLPVIAVPASGAGDTFAVLLSGDGGWAGLDKDVAAALAAQGIPVVGLDSLRYFWQARTPVALAADLDRVLRYYSDHWHKAHAVLVGYSQGADVLPFAMNRLSAASRTLVERTVMMGLGENASFQFHFTNWLGGDSDGLPILPEVDRLDAGSTLCLYGTGESDSLCPKVPRGHVQAIALPGGHHFGGGYDELARRIMAGLKVS